MSGAGARGVSFDGRRLARGFAAEYRRLRGDVVLAAFLPVSLISALSVAAAMPSDLRSAPPAVIAALGVTMRESLLGSLLVLAAILGSIGVTLADRTGVLAREQVFSPRGVVLAARATSSVVSASIFAVFGTAMVAGAFFIVSGRALFSPLDAASAVAVMAAAGLWGYLIGVLVRSPVLVLFVVPATLSPALLLAEALPEVSRALPLGALLAAGGAGGSRADAGTGAWTAAAWILGLALIVVLVLRRRDRL